MAADDDQIAHAMAAEIAEHREMLTLVLTPLTAVRLVGLLQLALRHPQVDEGNRRTAAWVIGHVSEFFADAPTVLEVFRRGNDPEEDR
jgi:hypothetical protein